MYHLFTLFTGMLISVMVAVNGSLSGNVGIYTSTVLIYVVSVLFSLSLLLAGKKRIFPAKRLPLWRYSAGVISVFSTVFTNFAYGKISVLAITALGLLAQTVTSFIIDAFGLFGVKKRGLSFGGAACLAVSICGIPVMLHGAQLGEAAAVAVAFASGVTLVVSRMINAELASDTGALSGAFINHLTGLPAALLALFVLGGGELAVAAPLNAVPWWAYLGGVLGIAVIAFNNVTVPRISAMQGTLLLFVGQMAAGTVIDIINSAALSPRLLIGTAIVTLGVCVNMLLGDKKSPRS